MNEGRDSLGRRADACEVWSGPNRQRSLGSKTASGIPQHFRAHFWHEQSGWGVVVLRRRCWVVQLRGQR